MTRSTFLKNLNVFFPYYALLAFVLGNFTNVFLRLLLSGVIDFDRNHNQLIITVQLATFLILVVIWKLYGLSPRPRKEKLKTYRNGHITVAIGNLALFCVVTALTIISISYGVIGNALFLAAPEFGLLLIAWFVGVVMIWVAT
jgi:hypothetical protein